MTIGVSEQESKRRVSEWRASNKWRERDLGGEKEERRRNEEGIIFIA